MGLLDKLVKRAPLPEGYEEPKPKPVTRLPQAPPKPGGPPAPQPGGIHFVDTDNFEERIAAIRKRIHEQKLRQRSSVAGLTSTSSISSPSVLQHFLTPYQAPRRPKR